MPGQVLSPDAYNTQLGPDGDVEYEDMNRDGVIDDRDRKRSFDDAFDDGSPPPAGGSSSVVFTEPSETPVFPAPADPQPAPADPQPGAPSLGEEVAVTAESLILLMNPLAASVIADNMQTGHFHRMDERASKVAAMWNALTGNQYADGSVRIPFDEWDYHRTQVKLDYLRAYEEYSSYLLVATNYHKSTIDTWRPTTMPDIVNIPSQTTPGSRGRDFPTVSPSRHRSPESGRA